MTYHSIGNLNLSQQLMVPGGAPAPVMRTAPSTQPITYATTACMSAQRVAPLVQTVQTVRAAATAPAPTATVAPAYSAQLAPTTARTAPTKSGTVADLCRAKQQLEALLRASPNATIRRADTGAVMTSAQVLALLQHREIASVCQWPDQRAALRGDGAEMYYWVDHAIRQLPTITTMAPPLMSRPSGGGAPLAPEVSQIPRDTTRPVEDETLPPEDMVDYYQAPAPSVPTEPSAPPGEQTLLQMAPEEKKFPWLWVILGVAAVGGGAYLLSRD